MRRRTIDSTRLAVAVVAIFLIGAFAGLGDGPTRAWAQDRSDKERAALERFNAGLALYNRGEFERACTEFEASLALYSGVGSRGKLAECYERIGRTASAWRLYKEVIRLADNEDRRQLAKERMDALEPRLARLTIDPGPSIDLSGFRVLRDDMEVPSRSYGEALIVDPGVYRIVAGARGHRSFRKAVKLADGTDITVAIPALDSHRRASATGLIVTGAGLALMLGGGTGFGLLARSQWQTARDRGCDVDMGICTDLDGFQAHEDARRSATLANIAIGAGALTAAIGGYLWWRGRTPKNRDAPVATTIQPAVGPDMFGVQMRHSF